MRQKPIATYEDFIGEFPSVIEKSKLLAKRILPLYPSSNLAKIVAALMTDGHIDWYTSDGRPRTRKVILYSSNREECEWFLKLCENVFDVKGKVIAYMPKYGEFKKQPYKTVIWNAVVARILILCGAPAGNKTEKEFLIPEWIMNGNREIKSEFLKAFFTFEGGTPYRKSKGYNGFQMSLFMNKDSRLLENGIHFLFQITKLLKSFGVSCSKVAARRNSSNFASNNGKNTIYFTVTGQKSIVNFYRNIGYLNPVKQRKLKYCISEIGKFHRLKSNAICRLIRKSKESIGTDEELAAQINGFTEKRYSNRQMEHFRRKETAVPLEIVYALIRINKNASVLKELPDYVQSLPTNVPSSQQ